jgi:Reverse transcriptase (RNA-dependent DNA polymerase)
MESGLHHQRRPIRTNGHVFRSNELTSNVPNYDEHNLQRRNGPKWLTIYMDDMAIHTRKQENETDEEHLQRHCTYVKIVLQRLQEHDLYLKPEKCTFEQPNIEFLGVRIENGTIQMDESKIKRVQEWPTPTTVTEI